MHTADTIEEGIVLEAQLQSPSARLLCNTNAQNLGQACVGRCDISAM